MTGSPPRGPEVGDGVRVARLDAADAVAGSGPVARFGGDALLGTPASGGADFSAIGSEPDGRTDRGAPVAQFVADQVGAARESSRVAEFGASARARRSPLAAAPGSERTAAGSAVSSARSAVRSAEADTVRGSDPAADVEASSAGSPGARRGGRREGSDRGGSQAARRPPGQIHPDADPVVVAREICLRLLTDRARTRQELAQALRRKGVPDEAAHTVLERFDEVGLIDDAAFAGQWVRSRHASKGLARRAIAMELRRKGVDDEVAGEALAGVDTASEEHRARQLVDRKLRSLTVDTAEQRATAARRLVGMLARKGYGGGIAYRVVREALAAQGADAEELDTDPPLD